MNHEPEIEKFYTSRAWRRCREGFLQSRGGLCENCMKRGLVEPATQIHHKIPISIDNLGDPSITLNYDNLMALCDRCHSEQHKRRRWRCDPAGHVSI